MSNSHNINNISNGNIISQRSLINRSAFNNNNNNRNKI
jgi:hypothetical protein